MTSRLSKTREGAFPPRHPDERIRMHHSSFSHQPEAFFESSMRNTQNRPDLTEYVWGWCEEHQKWCVMLVRFWDGAKPLKAAPTGEVVEPSSPFEPKDLLQPWAKKLAAREPLTDEEFSAMVRKLRVN